MGTIIGKGDNPTYRDLSREIQAALRQLQDQERKRHFVQAVLEHAAGHGGQSMQSQMHIDTLQYIYIYIFVRMFMYVFYPTYTCMISSLIVI